MKRLYDFFIHRSRLGKWLIGDWLNANQSLPNNTGLNSYKRWENRKHMEETFSAKINWAEIMFLRWLSVLFVLFLISDVIHSTWSVPALLDLLIFAPLSIPCIIFLFIFGILWKACKGFESK